MHAYIYICIYTCVNMCMCVMCPYVYVVRYGWSHLGCHLRGLEAQSSNVSFGGVRTLSFELCKQRSGVSPQVGWAVYVCAYMYMSAYGYAYTYIYIYICNCVYMHICGCVGMCMCVDMHMRMYACACIYIYA